MQIKDLGDRKVLKLESGEDLFVCLEKAVAGESTGWAVLIGIGMLENAEIGYFDGKEYQKKCLEAPHELVALHGTITIDNSIVIPHLHCGLVGPDHTLIGGHLFSGTVKVVCELVLMKLDCKMVRKEDTVSGLKLLDLNS